MVNSPLTDWGIPGFIILILAGVIVRLYTENRALYAKIEVMYKERLDSQAAVGEKLVQQMELTAERDRAFLERIRGK